MVKERIRLMTIDGLTRDIDFEHYIAPIPEYISPLWGVRMADGLMAARVYTRTEREEDGLPVFFEQPMCLIEEHGRETS